MINAAQSRLVGASDVLSDLFSFVSPHSFHFAVDHSIINGRLRQWVACFSLGWFIFIYQVDNFMLWMLITCLVFQALVPQGSVLDPFYLLQVGCKFNVLMYYVNNTQCVLVRQMW